MAITQVRFQTTKPSPQLQLIRALQSGDTENVVRTLKHDQRLISIFIAWVNENTQWCKKNSALLDKVFLQLRPQGDACPVQQVEELVQRIWPKECQEMVESIHAKDWKGFQRLCDNLASKLCFSPVESTIRKFSKDISVDYLRKNALRALEKGNASYFKIIAENCPPHLQEEFYKQDSTGRTFVHSAAVSGKEEALKIVFNVCPPQFKPQLFESKLNPLHDLVAKGTREAFECLIANYPPEKAKELFGRDTQGRHPMHYAAEKGKADTIHAVWLVCPNDGNLKEKQFDADNNGDTPLHAAARKGSAAVIKALLDICPEPKRKLQFQENKSGLTPLHLAIYSGLELDKTQIIVKNYPSDLKRKLLKEQPLRARHFLT